MVDERAKVVEQSLEVLNSCHICPDLFDLSPPFSIVILVGFVFQKLLCVESITLLLYLIETLFV